MDDDFDMGPPIAPIIDPDSDPYIGREFGGITIIPLSKERKYIGKGAMGVVYCGEKKIGGRTFRRAVKFLSDEKNEARSRFVGEIDLMTRINHPNVIPIRESGEQEGVIFYAMEFIENALTVNDICKFSDPEKIDVIFQAACGLEAIHAQGIIHRDVKPQNILVRFGENKRIEVKVADIGIGRHFYATERQTTVGDFVGTYPFSAPEAFIRKDVFKSDVFSLGATAYALFTNGESPFDDPSAGDGYGAAVYRKIIGDYPPPLATFDEVNDVIQWMLQKNPDDRPEMSDVIAALKKIRQALSPEEASARTAPIFTSEFQPQQHRSRIPAVAGSVLLVAVLGAGGWFGYKEAKPFLGSPQTIRFADGESFGQGNWRAENGVYVGEGGLTHNGTFRELDIEFRGDGTVNVETGYNPFSRGSYMIQSSLENGNRVVSFYRDNTEVKSYKLKKNDKPEIQLKWDGRTFRGYVGDESVGIGNQIPASFVVEGNVAIDKAVILK